MDEEQVQKIAKTIKSLAKHYAAGSGDRSIAENAHSYESMALNTISWENSNGLVSEEDWYRIREAVDGADQ